MSFMSYFSAAIIKNIGLLSSFTRVGSFTSICSEGFDSFISFIEKPE